METSQVYQSMVDFPKQCQQVISEFPAISVPENYSSVKNIVISGMGGSALGGRVIQHLERDNLKVPFLVSTEYDLPEFVDQDTLVVISSYSGSTQETISAFRESLNRQAKIFFITTGGEIAKIGADFKIPGYLINPQYNPSTQPRLGLGYGVTSLLCLMEKCGLVKNTFDLKSLAEYLQNRQQSNHDWETLSHQLENKVPVFIASRHLVGSLHCLKNQFNETAKNFALYFDIPELNHHLLEGLSHPVSNSDNLFFIFINSGFYPPEISKRYAITSEIVNKQHISFKDVHLSGPSRIFEAFELIQTGSFMAYYLSQKNGVDPSVIPWVDYFKKSFSSTV